MLIVAKRIVCSLVPILLSLMIGVSALTGMAFGIKYEDIVDLYEQPLYFLTPRAPGKVLEAVKEKEAELLRIEEAMPWVDRVRPAELKRCEPITVFVLGETHWATTTYCIPLVRDHLAIGAFFYRDGDVSLESRQDYEVEYAFDLDALKEHMRGKDDPAVLFSLGLKKEADEPGNNRNRTGAGDLIAWFPKTNRAYKYEIVKYSTEPKPMGYPWIEADIRGNDGILLENAKKVVRERMADGLVRMVEISEANAVSTTYKQYVPEPRFNVEDKTKELEKEMKSAGFPSNDLTWSVSKIPRENFGPEMEEMVSGWDLYTNFIPITLDEYVDSYFMRYVVNVNTGGSVETFNIEIAPAQNGVSSETETYSEAKKNYDLRTASLQEISEDMSVAFSESGFKRKGSDKIALAGDRGGILFEDTEYVQRIADSYAQMGWSGLSNIGYRTYDQGFPQYGNITLSEDERILLSYLLRKNTGYYTPDTPWREWSRFELSGGAVYIEKKYDGDFPLYIDFFAIASCIVVKPAKINKDGELDRFYYDPAKTSLADIERDMKEYFLQ